jgi:cytochrome c-type biogenesis protein CcmH
MTLFLLFAALLATAAVTAMAVPLLRATTCAGGAESATLSLQVLREQVGELARECRAGTLDPAQYAAEQAEIERRAIEDGRADQTPAAIPGRADWLVAALAAGVVAASAGLYALLGTPAALQPGEDSGAPRNAHALTPQQIEGMAAKLAERLQADPADGEGWLMLARSYNTLGRYGEAAAAFGRATSLLPADAQYLSDYADALAMAQGRRLLGAPEEIIRRALAADPRNVKALALSGSAAFERGDHAGAAGQWRKALEIVPADSRAAERLRASIADAQARAGTGRPGR